MSGLTGHGPVADAIYAALNGSFGDFGGDHAKKAANAVKRHILGAVEGHDAAEPESTSGEAYLLGVSDVREAIEALFEEPTS